MPTKVAFILHSRGSKGAFDIHQARRVLNGLVDPNSIEPGAQLTLTLGPEGLTPTRRSRLCKIGTFPNGIPDLKEEPASTEPVAADSEPTAWKLNIWPNLIRKELAPLRALLGWACSSGRIHPGSVIVIPASADFDQARRDQLKPFGELVPIKATA